MTKTSTLEQASQLIRGAQAPLLVCHVAPDGDALGSLTGLTRALRQLHQSPIPACADAIPSSFDYIPGVNEILQVVADSFDLIIALDCSDVRRVGALRELPHFNRRPLVNIDHHITNVNFGDVNVVDPEASSTAEVLSHLLDHLGIQLDETLATSLLIGIVTDTRGFRTSNVTPPVMEAALRLMEAGASLPYASRHGLDRRPTAVMRLWGACLSRLRIDSGVIWISIPLAMRREVGYRGNGDAGLASFLVSSDDAFVSVVFVEQEDGSVEVGMRAVPGFDVSQFAVRFGGGGHALASGFSIHGPLQQAEQRVLGPLQDHVARQQADET
ncbi:MAG: bifunctional oligoribonuclease/PAP phosphatase NrnA [Anaerolineae bacterium]